MPDSYVTTTLAPAAGGQGAGRRLAQMPSPAPPSGGGSGQNGLSVASQARRRAPDTCCVC